jgi:hypothetical protein
MSLHGAHSGHILATVAGFCASGTEMKAKKTS